MLSIAALNSLVAGQIREGEPLAPKVSIRTGGSADIFVRPDSIDAVRSLLRWVASEKVLLTVLGGGANSLVSDHGFGGVVLQLPSGLCPEEIERVSEGLLVTLGAGAPIARLIQLMRSHRCVGAEFLAGIPGTLGGAVAMNAGTKAGDCLSAVRAIEITTAEGINWIPKNELSYRYRRTDLPTGGVVTRVRFLLREGDVDQSNLQMNTDLAYRKRTQPLSLPSFGSVFTNPKGHFAGQLVEQVGLKGARQGQAQISSLHANWIVNLGGARACDVSTLILRAQMQVKEATGIELEPEVRRVGNFDET